MKATSTRSAVTMLDVVLALLFAKLANAQTFKKVSVKGNAKMKQVASGANSAWALSLNGTPYVFKTNKFVPAATLTLTRFDEHLIRYSLAL